MSSPVQSTTGAQGGGARQVRAEGRRCCYSREPEHLDPCRTGWQVRGGAEPTDWIGWTTNLKEIHDKRAAVTLIGMGRQLIEFPSDLEVVTIARSTLRSNSS